MLVTANSTLDHHFLDRMTMVEGDVSFWIVASACLADHSICLCFSLLLLVVNTKHTLQHDIR